MIDMDIRSDPVGKIVCLKKKLQAGQKFRSKPPVSQGIQNYSPEFQRGIPLEMKHEKTGWLSVSFAFHGQEKMVAFTQNMVEPVFSLGMVF